MRQTQHVQTEGPRSHSQPPFTHRHNVEDQDKWALLSQTRVQLGPTESDTGAAGSY